MFVKKFYVFALIFLASLLFTASARSLEKNKPFGETLCNNNPDFHCIAIAEKTVIKEIRTKNGLKKIESQVPQTWAELWPDEREREIVMKVNRLNIKLEKEMVIAVPNNMANKTFMDFSPFPQNIGVMDEKILIWDPELLAWAAYDETGNLVSWGPGVGGKDYCSDIGRQCHTVTGNFTIIKKGNAKTRSRKFHNAPMPWAMFFHRAGYAFHGSPNVPGMNASHGCVRIFTSDAEWLNKNFVKIGTSVIINPYHE
ncbi:MAG: L,D-transpeptidase [Patescibacteria group bacterium]